MPPASTAQDHVAALRQSLAQSQPLLKRYEWIETVVVSVKGEEKSRTQNRCYYGADGKVQGVPVAAPSQSLQVKVTNSGYRKQ